MPSSRRCEKVRYTTVFTQGGPIKCYSGTYNLISQIPSFVDAGGHGVTVDAAGCVSHCAAFHTQAPRSAASLVSGAEALPFRKQKSPAMPATTGASRLLLTS